MMLAHGSMTRVKAHFAAQFREEAQGLVYRCGGKGPAVLVTAAERDAFVAAFNRGIGRLVWLLLMATMLLLGAVELLADRFPPVLYGQRREGVLAVLMAGFLAAWWRIRNAPARALERRAEIGNSLSSAVARDENLAHMPWSIIAAGLLLPVALFVRVSFDRDPWQEDLGPIVVGLVALPVVAAIGIAKVRAMRRVRVAAVTRRR